MITPIGECGKRRRIGGRMRHLPWGQVSMDGVRFKETGMGSFFGELVYDEVVPETHFLRALEAVVDWSAFTEQLLVLYEGRGQVGRPP